MEWIEVSQDNYRAVFGNSWTVFHSAAFNELNNSKVIKLFFLHFKSVNSDFGIILGHKENVLLSPFSSPFGGVECIGNPENLDILNITTLLVKKLKQLNYSTKITYPPLFYKKKFIREIIDASILSGFKTAYTDINFHLSLEKEKNPEDIMERNARKNLRKGINSSHIFRKASTIKDQEKAYTVIQKNRNEKGYPLKLTFEDLIETGKIVPIDFYLLEMNQEDAAAAIVFQINKEVAMVVYWGHLQKFSENRPVNLMAYYLYNLYKEEGFSQLDIGPSSEFGILNEGLANFKDSIGCVRTEKITLTLNYE